MRHSIQSILVALFLLFVAGVAEARDWTFSLTPYAWGTDIGMKADLDGRQVVDQKVPVSDLVKVLDTTVQGRFEAQYKSVGLSLDVFDVNLSDNVNGVPLPQNAGSANLSTEVGMTIFDVTGLFDPKGDLQGVQLLYGTRILDNRASVDVTFQPAPGVSMQEHYDGSETLVDGLIGLRYTKRFTRHWSLTTRADVSTGGTDYTWSAGPSVAYAFGSMGRHGLTVGYRTMKIDFEDQNGLDSRMTLSGFLVGLRSSF